MPTSGTTNFQLDLLEIIEEAFERASSGTRELRAGYELRTARRSLSLLLLEWANRGLNLWTIEEVLLPLVVGQASYLIPEDTVDLIEHVTSMDGRDLPLTRISLPTFAGLPNKDLPGRPNLILVTRHREPAVTLWPVPHQEGLQLRAWRLRRIQDVGAGNDAPDVPFRFLPALISGLAYYIAQKIPEGAPLQSQLKVQYDMDWVMAAEEDRERATVRFVPALR
jgi:hypothetical protein